MSIGARIVLRPHRIAFSPTAVAIGAEDSPAATTSDLRIHQSRKREFRFDAPIRRQRKVAVLDSWILPEWFLKRVKAADRGKADGEYDARPREAFAFMRRDRKGVRAFEARQHRRRDRQEARSSIARAAYIKLILTISKLNRSGGSADTGAGLNPAHVLYAVFATGEFR
jgi:hypothetical protein